MRQFIDSWHQRQCHSRAISLYHEFLHSTHRLEADAATRLKIENPDFPCSGIAEANQDRGEIIDTWIIPQDLPSRSRNQKRMELRCEGRIMGAKMGIYERLPIFFAQ
jgi:hypothetical protein